MHCNICDKQLSEKEIVFSTDLDTYEPCSECLEIAMDAAYSQGYLTEDDEFVLIDDFETLEDTAFTFAVEEETWGG